MTVTEKIDYGVVRFMPVESFANPYRGLSAEERTDKIFEVFTDGETKPASLSDWPRVVEAICRDGVFVIEASTPAFRAMLRFCPEKPNAGFKITPVAKDDTDTNLSMLAPFENRYAIVTAADNRSKTHLIWLVGLKNVRQVSETDEGV